MSKQKRPKNRYCLNSKLTEEEFARIVWGFLSGWSTVATRERLFNVPHPENPDQKITATERTIWTYYRRIGLYLFEKVRDRLIEEVRYVKGGIPEKYSHSPQAIFEYVFDAAMDELTHEEFWALHQLKVKTPKDYMLSSIRVISARKRGIPRSKVEHVALVYYFQVCAFELKKRAEVGGQKFEEEELFKIAHAELLETFLRDPLGRRDKLARTLSRRADDRAEHLPWLVGELPTYELRMQEAELEQARQRWELPRNFTIEEVESIYLRRINRIHKTKVEQNNRDYEMLLEAASK